MPNTLKNKRIDKLGVQVGRSLLALLPPDRPVTVEELTRKLPWARWADLFVIIGQLKAEGKLSYHQRGFDFEIWSDKELEKRKTLSP